MGSRYEELGKMLDEKIIDAEQNYRRAIGSNIDDAKLLKARQALDVALMQRDCFVDGRAYGSGSGNSDDFSSIKDVDPAKPAPRGRGDYSGNKWSRKRYG